MNETWIDRVATARWNRWLCRALGFATGAGCVWWWWDHSATGVPSPGIVATGVVAYTLYEYVVHRFLFHGRRAPALVRRGHGLHHRDPHTHRSMPFIAVAVQVVVLITLSVVALGPTDGPLFTAVFAAGYAVYGALHTLVHRDDLTWPWLVRFRITHGRHHDRPGANFGVTTSLWDRVFGTWDPVDRVAPSRTTPTRVSG